MGYKLLPLLIRAETASFCYLCAYYYRLIRYRYCFAKVGEMGDSAFANDDGDLGGSASFGFYDYYYSCLVEGATNSHFLSRSDY